MVIIRDTRDKRGKHDNVDNYLSKCGHTIVYRKLDVGDVMAEGIPGVSIDLKRNLGELSKNVTNRKDRSRFLKEIRRARQQGVKLYILCEHGHGVNSIQDIYHWTDPYSKVSGRSLMDAVYRLHISWDIEFVFCDKNSTGRKIMDILEGSL